MSETASKRGEPRLFAEERVHQRLIGVALPALTLESTVGRVDLAELATDLLVLFFYPHVTGLPDSPAPGWELIPGARAELLLERGATAAASPADAAERAEVVITLVADPQALRAVTESTDGVIAGARPGTTIVEMSTVGPAAISRLASRLPPQVALLDAPVLGSLTEAEAGALTIFIGGRASLVARWRRLLSTLGTPVHVGPLGAGAAANSSPTRPCSASSAFSARRSRSPKCSACHGLRRSMCSRRRRSPLRRSGAGRRSKAATTRHAFQSRSPTRTRS